MTTTAAIIAAGEARAALVATLPRTQLIRGVDMDEKITWGPIRTYYGSGECPADARDVPCMIIYAPGDTCGDKGIFSGSAWLWEGVIAYRLPADVPAPADPVRDALVAALTRWQSYGCPDCAGDCGSANPPVNFCIIQQTCAALTLAKGEKP